MVSGIEFVLIGFAAMAAGLVNALAGGGTLITFPMLTAVGVPAIAANVTNTVALCPGYLGATLAQSKDLRGQRRRLWLVVPAGVIGGVLGGLLLLHTGERVFRALVPFLILLASGLLAVQGPVRAWLLRRAARAARAGARVAAPLAAPIGSLAGSPAGTSARVPPTAAAWIALPVGAAAVYGGYFGAGVSVIVLAVLGLLLDDTLTRLNALKQVISLSTNVAAAIFFICSGRVVWPAALVMAAGALIGGSLGGRLAGRLHPTALRWTVVGIGVAVALIYWAR